MATCEAKWWLGEIVLQCDRREGHDNPLNEIGSTRTESLHKSSYDEGGADGITMVYVYWLTPNLFGESGEAAQAYLAAQRRNY